MNEEQAKQLRDLLDEYDDVVCQKIGTVEGTAHNIETGEHGSVRSAPYRLAPAWRDQLREEVRTLHEQGILKTSLSSWSSPMVPVRNLMGRYAYV